MKILTASEGMVWALKSDLTIFGKIIHLGVNDFPENWIEVEEPEQTNEICLN